MIKPAEFFDVSMDYLAFEVEGQSVKVSIKDRELLRRFEEIDKLSEKDQGIIKEILDTFIIKNKFQSLAALKKVINEKCHQAFLSADKGEYIIIIPAVVFMEMLYLFEKNRIKIDLFQTEELLKSKNYQFEPLSLEIIKTESKITDIPELHDRLIAATAKYFNISLITNDPEIKASKFVNILR